MERGICNAKSVHLTMYSNSKSHPFQSYNMFVISQSIIHQGGIFTQINHIICLLLVSGSNLVQVKSSKQLDSTLRKTSKIRFSFVSFCFTFEILNWGPTHVFFFPTHVYLMQKWDQVTTWERKNATCFSIYEVVGALFFCTQLNNQYLSSMAFLFPNFWLRI